MKKSRMPKATLIAEGNLKDFLGNRIKEAAALEIDFELHPSVKDLIEAQGIPHTAIFKLQINGHQQPLTYNMQDGDTITASPFKEADSSAFDPIFSRPSSFVVDGHLGKLVKTLRLLGLDSAFNKEWTDEDLIEISTNHRRMILTRDVALLKNGKAEFGYWVRSQDPDQQIKELFKRFSLSEYLAPFSRCMKCNGSLSVVPLSEVKGKVPPKVQKWHSQFFQCHDCGQVYWKGSHFENLQQKVAELIDIHNQ